MKKELRNYLSYWFFIAVIFIIFFDLRPIKSRTFVPGKSNYIYMGSNKRIKKILEKNPNIKESIEKEFTSYTLCNDTRVLNEEEKYKNYSQKICTTLYFALAKEKIWFKDEILWEVVNYKKINIQDPRSKEICYDAKLLGTGKGIKCFTPRKFVNDPDSPLPYVYKNYEASCSDAYLNKNPKIKKELIDSLESYEKKPPFQNIHSMDCNSSSKKGSNAFRSKVCLRYLPKGNEDQILGLLVGKYCREKFPDMIGSKNYRNKLQKEIANDLIKFNAEENKTKEIKKNIYKDLMSDKYTNSQRRIFCMEEAIEGFRNSTSFYKEYCDKLMR